jgi:hypothetical protein
MLAATELVFQPVDLTVKRRYVDAVLRFFHQPMLPEGDVVEPLLRLPVTDPGSYDAN